MATSGPARTAYTTETGRRVDDVIRRDAYGSQAGFDDPRDRARIDTVAGDLERRRSPEAAGAVINEMDGDAQLLSRILAERRGLRGVASRIKEMRTGIRAVDFCLRQIGKIPKIAAVGGAGLAIRSAAIGLGVPGPVASAIGGGVVGGFTGWMRGRNREQSAATWMANLRVLELSADELADPNLVPTEDIVTALGVMRNAIRDGKVRGSVHTRLEMVSKYRLLRDTLQARHVEQARNPGEMNPVMQRIDQALGDAVEDGQLISEMAATEMRETYEKIIGLKNKKIAMSALKGAVTGAAVGGALGFLVNYAHQHGMLEGTSNWVKEHVLGIKDAHGGGDSVQDALHAKRDTILAGNQGLQDQIRAHDININLHESMDPVTQGHFHGVDVNPQTHIASINDPNGVNVIANGNAENLPYGTQLPGGTPEIMGHLTRLADVQHGNLYGFTINGDATRLVHFNEMLQNGDSLRNLTDFAGQNNIDLGANNIGRMLIDHRDAYFALPPDIQNFVLSHPSVASEFLSSSSRSIPDAINAAIGKVMGVVGLSGQNAQLAGLGAGVGLAGIGAGVAHGVQRGADRGIWGALGEKRSALHQETAEASSARRQQNVERQRENRNQSQAELTGSTVILTNLPAGYAGRREFVVERVDPDGRLVFMNTSADVAARRLGNDPHPTIMLNNLLQPDGAINRGEITVTRRVATGGTAAAPGAPGAGIEFDAAPYNEIIDRGGEYQGELTRVAGKNIFRLSAPIAGITGNDIEIKGAGLDNYPSGFNYNVQLKRVEGDNRGNPIFDVDIRYNDGANNYEFGRSYPSGAAATKKTFLTTLAQKSSLGATRDILVWFPSFRRDIIYRFVDHDATANTYRFEDNAVPPNEQVIPRAAMEAFEMRSFTQA